MKIGIVKLYCSEDPFPPSPPPQAGKSQISNISEVLWNDALGEGFDDVLPNSALEQEQVCLEDR